MAAMCVVDWGCGHAQERNGTANISAAQVFALADRARAQRDFATAEAAYKALQDDADAELCNEARFRLGMMLADDLKRYSEAAILFRRILDDRPNTARVRIELARVLALSGNLRSAEREFRAAQAAGLPPEVERMVRLYAMALNAKKPFGGSIEVALAPDSNINRATRSNTLGTVIGDFTLDDNARAKSGVGLSLRGQSYLREGLDTNSEFLVRMSASGNLYRDSAFNDISLGLQAGPQYTSGRDRITFSAGPVWRWFGRQLYTVRTGGTVTWQHPSGRRSQMRLEGEIAHVDNRRNALQTADDFAFNVSLDRAFSARFGAGIQAFALREQAHDPGYSLTTGGATVYAFREIGRTTLVATAGYGRLEADRRLFLYPRRRMEDRYSASLGATLRSLQVAGLAPLARVRWERNRSSIEIYDHKRVSAEFGVTSIF